MKLLNLISKTVGGGRTLSANVTRRCLAETGSVRKVDTRTSVVFGRAEVAVGEAEWAVTQTVHFNAPVALEWWCETNANADPNVSTRHSHATAFEIDLKSITQ